MLLRTKYINERFLKLINIFLIALTLTSCATVGTSSYLDYIKTHDGNYLALPPRGFTQIEAEQFGSKYGAVVRFAPSHGAIAAATESLLDTAVGPSSYHRGIANEIETMLDSSHTWNIFIIPENRDFMISVFKLIPYGRQASPVKIVQLADINPELQAELQRLNLLQPK